MPSDIPRDAGSVRRFVLNRFERNLSLSLDQVLALDPTLVVVSELEAMRMRGISDGLAELDPAAPEYVPGARESLIEDMVGELKRYLYQRNQYLEIPERVIPRIRANYERFIDQSVAVIRQAEPASELAQRLSPVVRAHIADLNGELAELLPQMPKILDERGDHYGDYPCYEYSSELQLRLIGEENISGRVLDLGCGRSAGLVESLRRRGFAAYGLDRAVPAGPHFYECDWFDFQFQPESWDTVISHMALSNHIIHQLAAGTGELAAYIALYARVLASLRPGGRFIYAPALPFLEQSLARAGYAATARPFTDGRVRFSTTIVRRNPRCQ